MRTTMIIFAMLGCITFAAQDFETQRFGPADGMYVDDANGIPFQIVGGYFTSADGRSKSWRKVCVTTVEENLEECPAVEEIGILFPEPVSMVCVAAGPSWYRQSIMPWLYCESASQEVQYFVQVTPTPYPWPFAYQQPLCVGQFGGVEKISSCVFGDGDFDNLSVEP